MNISFLVEYLSGFVVGDNIRPSCILAALGAVSCSACTHPRIKPGHPTSDT